MKTVIINGANGYVASNFVRNLLKQHYHVIALVRANKQDAEERMNNALAIMNDGENINTNNLEVYNYSLCDDDYSMDKNILKSIFSSNIDYFHFAASLKYDEKSMDEIFSTNIEGVENSIKVFSKYATTSSRFFYIGTAYSCGRLEGVFKEQFYQNEDISAFRNYYEQSKRFAENIIKGNIEKNGLNAHIIRLSQVVGNHETGITRTDYGIFDFAKRISSLATRFPNEIVRVRVDADSTQNLIPVDTVTQHLTRVVEKNSVPRIMNFVSNRSIQNSHIIETLNQILPLHLIPMKGLEWKDMNQIERLVSVGMSFTESYTSTNIHFETVRRDELLKNPETGPDEKSISEMLRYYIENNLAKKKSKKYEAA
ncbi:SDR family oxidoreductase [Maribellus sp. YY47]|uniref:SDR family oxidoreductase n=1 Tax=Maribellus sp. YY47 TaxID=2929486 RepID=UPI002001912D|nr:SDR family oxidoreductase [Maribellus sp. YY47]MCK3683077.1 SDR family oxidoreductase [Maribellus sp. YY47]